MFKFLVLVLTFSVLYSCSSMNDFYQIQEQNGKFGLVNKSDSVTTIPFNYDKIYEPWGLWILDDNNKRYVDNLTTGGWYIGQKEDYLDIFNIRKPENIYTTKEQYEAVEMNALVLAYETINFVVQQNGLWGVINENEQKLVAIQYDAVNSEEMTTDFIFVKKDNQWGISDYKNQLIAPTVYDSLLTTVNHSFIIAKENEKFGLINKNGKTIIPFEYDEIDDFTNHQDKNKFFQHLKKEKSINFVSYYGNLMVRKGDKIGLLSTGNDILVDIKYDFIFGMYRKGEKRIYAIYDNDKFGLIKPNNEILLDIEYQDIKQSKNKDYAFIKKNNKVGVWNHEMESFVCSLQYDEIYDFDMMKKYFPPKKAFLLVKKDGKLFWINNKGEVLEEEK